MQLAVIGGGPAGLRAAEVAAASGASVTLFDAKPSVGRKFLVAGKGGLNITKSEPAPAFISQYSPPLPLWESLYAEFSPEALRQWAAQLGVETFAASTGRVYPKEMRAAPLLRRWVTSLRTHGVRFHMRHRWTGLRKTDRFELEFATPEGIARHYADAVVLAMGGCSWPETGSDGNWVESAQNLGLEVSPFQPANCGWECEWPSAILPRIEGKPLKALAVEAQGKRVLGELLVTRYGLEGGALYQLGPALRAMQTPRILVDFRPHSPLEKLAAKIQTSRAHPLAAAKSLWRLDETVFAIFRSSDAVRQCTSAHQLAALLKSFPISLIRPRPIAEAISSAGGIKLDQWDSTLMSHKIPGLFAAGEMLDWEAPTGGYLMQACFMTGTRAGKCAALWLQGRS